MRVRALCDKYDLPYTTGSLVHQYFLTLRTIHKLALPDSFLTDTCHDAPETASEQKFWPATSYTGPATDPTPPSPSVPRERTLEV